jgi:GT2 family glycosyltransferase
MINILAVLTCYNRKTYTEQAIRKLVQGNPLCKFSFIVVDDNSTDGTFELVNTLKNEFDIHIIKGSGQLFYSGGMRVGMNYALDNYNHHSFDYFLMLNDDVIFFESVIEKLTRQSENQGGAIIVGATCDDENSLSYGAIKYLHGYIYRKIPVADWQIPADTFNANCVLIPFEIFVKTGSIDPYYIHSLGDFDYGLNLKRNGFRLFSSKEYVGICNTNSSSNTWTDINLNREDRIKKKESVKGAPAKQWFYFLNKNFGFLSAIIGSCSPYFRILIGK